MVSDRLLVWLAERVGFRVTGRTFLRIVVFALAMLVVVSLILPARPGDLQKSPYNAALSTSSVRNVALPFGDPRGFQPSTADASSYKVAWIGGSETLAVGPKTRAFIPGLVSDRIKAVDGRRLSVDVYYLDASRLADQLSALSFALAAKPDLVVVSLNPVWVMNDLAVQQWGYLDGVTAQHSVWPPSRWRISGSLVSPGDVGWRLLSGLSPDGVGDRYAWGVDLASGTEQLTFLHPVPGAARPAPTGLVALGQTRPVDFFARQFRPSRPATDLTIQQLGLLERQAASRSRFNEVVLEQMLEMVDRADVDAYFYVPPIKPEVYAEADARMYMDDLRSKLAQVASGRSSRRIHFDPAGLQDRVPTTEYRDLVHVFDGRPEAVVLARDICVLVATRPGHRGCESS